MLDRYNRGLATPSYWGYFSKHFREDLSPLKVGGPWKATVTNEKFLLFHLLDKWKKQIINEHLILFTIILFVYFTLSLFYEHTPFYPPEHTFILVSFTKTVQMFF